MATILIEGFDFYSAAQANTMRGWSQAFSSMQAGRLGSGQCARLNNGFGGETKALPSTYGTLIGGFAFRISNAVSATVDLFQFRVGATLAFRVAIDTSSKLFIRNSGGTTIASGTTALLANTWYYIEVKAFQNGASGTCELHLNGVSGEIASTTGNFGSSNFDTVALNNGTGSVSNFDFDDLYVCDTSGSARNTFLGDQFVETIYPDGAGNSTAWTASTGSAYQCIDEAQANGDTDYISSSTVNNVSTFTASDLTASSGTVNGVQANHFVRKDDAAARQIATVIRQGGTDYVGTTLAALSTSYTIQSQLYDKDPAAADWTISNVNGDEYGVKEIV